MTYRRLGFTGTRNIGGFEADLRSYLMKNTTSEWLGYFSVYITGACRGWDAYIGRFLARTRPDIKQEIIVPADRSQVDYWWREQEFYELVKSGQIEIYSMPKDTSYRDRNTEIVKRSTHLFYCADYEENDPHSKRSGTWMTKRIAERHGMRDNIYGIILHGAPETVDA